MIYALLIYELLIYLLLIYLLLIYLLLIYVLMIYVLMIYVLMIYYWWSMYWWSMYWWSVYWWSMYWWSMYWWSIYEWSINWWSMNCWSIYCWSQSLLASHTGYRCSVVCPRSRGMALSNVIFPKIRLACSLLLRYRRRGLNSNSDKGRLLQVGRDSPGFGQYSKHGFLPFLWSLERNMVPLLERRGWDGLPLCNV